MLINPQDIPDKKGSNYPDEFSSLVAGRSNSVAIYLEIGDRTPEEEVNYPDVNLIAKHNPQGWVFNHKDGSGYAS